MLQVLQTALCRQFRSIADTANNMETTVMCCRYCRQ
jgi:hypothetical protein